jgi:hypothetical protein
MGSGYGLVLGWLAAMGSLGCGEEAPAASSEEEMLGSVELEIMQAPVDAQCLRLTVDSELTLQKVVRTQGLTAATTRFAFSGLPLGQVGILGEAFNVTCPNITANTPMTWTSARTVVTLLPNAVTAVNLILNPAGKANVAVDFTSSAQFEDVPAGNPSSKITTTPSGTTALFTLPVSATVWSATTGLNSALLTTMPPDAGAPSHIATTSSGHIVVAGSSKLAVFTSTGAFVRSVALGFSVTSDLVIDSAGNAWVGATTGQLVRVASVASANPLVVSPVLGPQFTASVGLAVATSGVLAVSSSLTRLRSYSPTGQLLEDRTIPAPLRDVVVAADQTIWGYNGITRVLSQLPATGSGTLFQTTLLTPSNEVTGLISTTKGIFVGVGGRQLFQLSGGAVKVLDVPLNADIGGLTSTTDGRVWATDRAIARVVAITVP